MVIYIIRCSNVALVRLVSLSVGMHCGTSCTRTYATFPKKPHSKVERERHILHLQHH